MVLGDKQYVFPIESVNSGGTGETQTKSVTITENGTTRVVPDSGKTLSSVLITVDVAGLDSFIPVGKTIPQYYGEPTPAQMFPNTSWEINTAMQGRTIIGSGGDYTFGATGGSATHSHESGNIYALISDADVDKIDVRERYTGLGNWQATYRFSGASATAGTAASHEWAVETIGTTASNSNMPPYIVVNYWKRTA